MTYTKVLSTLFLLFLFLYAFIFRSELPSKWIQDSDKIMNIINDNSHITDGSFYYSALILDKLSLGYINIFIFIFGIFFTLLYSTYINNKNILILLLLFIPNLFFNLLVPGKELVVLFLTTIIVLSVHYVKNTFLSIIIIILLYSTYAYYVRIYYIVILFLFLFLFLIFSIRKKFLLMILFIALIVSFFIPKEIYYTLVSQRDIANTYAISVGSDNRTAFNNLIHPTNLYEFLINYIYTSSILTFPILYFYTIKELFLTLINLIVLSSLIKPIQYLYNVKIKILISLFLSHILTLLLFEPDLGSFLRHYSSYILYISAILYFTLTTIHTKQTIKGSIR